ncbi:MAG: NYN domain-containing protein [Candidatus Kariarchaeaceae archaeon]|jgi:uncharacterized protein (TIGR00288 family)
MGTSLLNNETLQQQNVIDKLGKILEILEEKEEKSQICILWDVENVNPGVKSLFVDGLLEFVSKKGRVTIAKAFGNWKSPSIAKMAGPLSAQSFELIHSHAPVKRKNSADIEMITNGIETALQYPNLSIFYLISGDSDFRPLVNSLRRNGKEVYIIYDNKRVSEELLSAADDYIDYRQLIPGGTEEDEVEEKEKIVEVDIEERMKEGLVLLSECIQKMEEEKVKTDLSSVKVRMKVLNPQFDEKILGFSQWSKFVERGVSEGIITLEGTQEKTVIRRTKKRKGLISIPYQELLDVLTKLDKSKKPRYHLFSVVNHELKKARFDYTNHGYKQFKKYLLDLETRNYVEIKVEGLAHSVKRVL